MSNAVSASVLTDGRTDFDFLFGRWHILNRKLVEVADPDCAEWVEFGATSSVEPILDGLGNVDRMWAEAPAGGEQFEGFTLRQFDPEAGVWRIWWASSRRPGHLDPPVVGSWVDGLGTFICDDVLNGRAVKVRFEWRAPQSASAARWEQAFSYDGGTTWRTNWIMEFSRRDHD